MTMTYQHIEAARQRLKGQAHVTPVMTSRTLNQLVGADIFFKCENYQRVGAFKFRGAFNAMSKLTDEQKAKGVLTLSSGNHAQAVALVGRLLDIRTTVIMPDNAPATKRSATEAYGARVIDYDPDTTSREAVVDRFDREGNYTLVHPFDHEDIIAGQGTATLELAESIGHLDMLLVPCGGGGLLSGSAIAAKGLYPNCRVIGIEPEVADDATRSFHTKILQTVPNPPTIADGTRTPSLGNLTFPLILKYVDDMRTVTEEAIMEAVRFLFYRMKMVVEPSGALGLAALLSGSVKPVGKVGIIISGGNIDGPTMTLILNSEPVDH